MDEIYTYTIDLPSGIDEVVVPCADGHTIYLASRLDRAGRIENYRHAIEHIRRDDWSRDDVQAIECEARL